jgi:hypothetical protein
MRRLTHDQVADARRRYARREATAAVLAAELGVSVSAVKHAVTGRTWANMTDPPPVRRPGDWRRSAPGRTPSLTRKSVLDIVRLRDTEQPTWRAIGALYGVDASVAYRAYQAEKRRRTRRRPPGLTQQLPPYAGELRRLWADPTLTVHEIVDRLGISWRSATKYAAAMGLTPPRQRARFRTRAVGSRRPNDDQVRDAAAKRLRELWADPQYTLLNIAAELDVSERVMRRWASELGLPVRPRQYPGASLKRRPRQERLRELWATPGLPAWQIAQELGVSRPTVYIWATKMGLPERPPGRKRAR